MAAPAFDRAPDLAGLGYWIEQMDHGAPLEALATSFMASAEFNALYGADLAAGAFVAQLYHNALHRAPDQGGLAYWVDVLAANDTAPVRAAMLARFSDSAENVDQLAQAIGTSIDYVPWGA